MNKTLDKYEIKKTDIKKILYVCYMLQLSIDLLDDIEEKNNPIEKILRDANGNIIDVFNILDDLLQSKLKISTKHRLAKDATKSWLSKSLEIEKFVNKEE